MEGLTNLKEAQKRIHNALAGGKCAGLNVVFVSYRVLCKADHQLHPSILAQMHVHKALRARNLSDHEDG
jgi:hypothetical protein